MSTQEIIGYIAGLIMSLIVVVLGILCRSKNIVAGWLKFNNSLGLGKREINDKAFSLYRIVGVIWIVMGGLTLGLGVFNLLSSSIQNKIFSLFY